MNRPSIVALALSVLASLFIAGVVHIVTMLALPEVGANDAFSRLSKLGVPARQVLLPAAAPKLETAPFSDPALAQAVCLYDLSQAPLHVSAKVDGNGFLSLSFHTRSGRVFYSMTDLAAVRGEIDIVVMTQAQLAAAEADDDDAEPPQELRLVSQTPTGFVLIQALVDRPLDRLAAETRLRSVKCAPEEDEPD